MKLDKSKRLTKTEERPTLRELALQRVRNTPQHADPLWMSRMWARVRS